MSPSASAPPAGLTEEQLAVQATVRDFVDDRVLPVAVRNDREHRLDWDLVDGMRDLGLLGAILPEEYGGAGVDWVTEVLVCEELERGEAALRTLMSVHLSLTCQAILAAGTEEQRCAWLPELAAGGQLACFALTEPAAGSDVAALETVAHAEPGGYRLHGQKAWISFATVADVALVFAKTDPGAGVRGISAFLVDLQDTPGLHTANIDGKLGMWAGPTGEIFLDGVFVSDDRRIGDPGDGFRIAMHALDQGRLSVAAGAVGVIRACLEAAVRYAGERETFGRPIARHQLVLDMVADIVLMYEQARLVVLEAARAKDRARHTGARTTREVSIAKVVATEYAFKAADLSLQVHGGWGYAAEYGVERHLRNSRAPRLYEGTTQIHKLLLGQDALGIKRLDGSR